LKPLPQVALTSTSNCIHEDGANIKLSASTDTKYLPPTYPTVTVYHKSFFHAFKQAKLSISFWQFRTAVTLDFKARATLQNSDEKPYCHSCVA